MLNFLHASMLGHPWKRVSLLIFRQSVVCDFNPTQCAVHTLSQCVGNVTGHSSVASIPQGIANIPEVGLPMDTLMAGDVSAHDGGRLRVNAVLYSVRFRSPLA